MKMKLAGIDEVGPIVPNRRDIVLGEIHNLLLALGTVPGKDPNFKETPRRFGDFLLEHFILQEEFDQEIAKLKKSKEAFPSKYSGMVFQPNIDAFGICPHHLLPIIYQIHVAYLPTKGAVGLSKLPRLAKLCAKLPILQECMTELLVDSIMDITGCPDTAAVVCGIHGCMLCRGIQAINSCTVTTSLRGKFMKSTYGSARHEFMEHLARETK